MAEKIKISTKKVNVFYGDKKALENINLEIPEKICDKNKIYIQKNSLLKFL